MAEQDFSGVQVFTGTEGKDVAVLASTAIESSRAVAEAKAAIVVAQNRPRNELDCCLARRCAFNC